MTTSVRPNPTNLMPSTLACDLPKLDPVGIKALGSESWLMVRETEEAVARPVLMRLRLRAPRPRPPP